jgi:hypothetical protein
MPVYHDVTGLVIPADDPAVPASVRGSDYLKAHRSPDWLILAITAQPVIVGTNHQWAVPLARTEWRGFSRHRVKYHLQYIEWIRLICHVIETPGKGVLSAWASNDGGGVWASLDGASGPQCSLNPAIPYRPPGEDYPMAAVVDSGWKATSATVRGYNDPLIRITGEGGDGATITKFGSVLLYGR